MSGYYNRPEAGPPMSLSQHAQRPRTPPRRRGGSRWTPFLLGLVVSLPLHALLVAILAGWHRPTGSIGQSDAPREIVLALAPVVRESVAETVPTPSIESPMVTGSVPDAQSSTSPGLTDAGGADDPTRQAGIIAGSGGGGGAGGANITFFGAGGKGKRIGFAVDSSGSMLAGSRLRHAQEELIRSVSELPDYVSVCVAFFNDVCVAPPPPIAGATDIRGYAKVRPGMIVALRHWLQQVPAKGGTRPARAIRHLFEQGDPPDVIFLLSDGEIPEEEVESILAINTRQGPAPIHCISFDASENATGNSLRRIAEATGGTFTATRPTNWTPVGRP